MGRSVKTTLVRLLERQLMEDYDRVLTHAVRYQSGWNQAQEAYARLSAFRSALVQAQEAMEGAEKLDRAA
ncbi:MAG: hypothetical protein HYX93_07175 [Chloroflexi bacterium]|nr:hypothetical protein [Chloroflexota bacterium]